MNLKINRETMKFTIDKQGHMWAGMAISLSTPSQFAAIGVVMACWIALFKELLWDEAMQRGTPDICDVIWTCIGALMGYAMRDLGKIPFIIAGVM